MQPMETMYFHRIRNSNNNNVHYVIKVKMIKLVPIPHVSFDEHYGVLQVKQNIIPCEV